jgi:hypothetical protein
MFERFENGSMPFVKSHEEQLYGLNLRDVATD